MLEKIIKAFAKSEKASNPELAAAIDEAQANLKQRAELTKPGQEQRDITAAVSSIYVRGGGLKIVIKQGPNPHMLVQCARAANLPYVLTSIERNVLSISTKPSTIIFANGGSTSVVSGKIFGISIGGVAINGNSSRNAGRNMFSSNNQSMTFTSNFGVNGDLVESSIDHGNGDCVQAGGDYLATLTIELPNVNELTVSGSTSIDYHDISSGNLTVDISGSADISLAGVCTQLDASISGAATIKAKSLIAKKATLSVSGAGDIRTTITDQIKARVSGAGDIKVFGNPGLRDTKVSGAGEIKFR